MATVQFRDFEERDIEFIYKCKNDERLNSLIVGQYHPFTHEEAVKWVHGCMGEHDNFKFWAICTHDVEKRIVGWMSLSKIDRENQSACFHGIVIGDKNYNDGFAWIESYLFIMDYVFVTLGLNRLYGSSLVGHAISNSASDVFLWTKEGQKRQALYKNGRFYDIKLSSILKEEYILNKKLGKYDLRSILKRIRQFKKTT